MHIYNGAIYKFFVSEARGEFGSFAFLALALCGWKNANVPNVRWVKLSDNVLRLCEEADFGAQNCQRSTKVDAR